MNNKFLFQYQIRWTSKDDFSSDISVNFISKVDFSFPMNPTFSFRAVSILTINNHNPKTTDPFFFFKPEFMIPLPFNSSV